MKKRKSCLKITKFSSKSKNLYLNKKHVKVEKMEDDTPKSKPRVFQLNDAEEKFEELEIDDGVPLSNLLNSDIVVLFLSIEYKTAWLWIGNNTSPRMPFIAAKEALSIRDRYGSVLMKIKTEEQEKESLGFQIFIGLIEPPEPPRLEEKKPLTQEFKFGKEEEILLELEKHEVPEGYERDLILSQGNIYKYHIGNFMGTPSPELISLREIVPNGMYPFEEYMTRLLFIDNIIQIVEFLKKK